MSRLAPYLLVFGGGAVGAVLREAVSLAIPGHPLRVILAVNVVGAFVLGLLLDLLAGYPDTGRRKALRLAVGTGVCGGFTTYSTLSVQQAELVRDGDAGIAALYAVGTLVIGALATLLGMLAADRIGGRESDRREAP